MVPGYLTGLCVAVANETQGAVPRYLLYLRVGEDCNLLVVACCVRCRLGAFEVIAPDQNSYMAGVFCEEHALLGRCKPAAHNKDILACEKFSVAGGAVSDAPATKMLLAPKTYRARMCAGGQQDAKTSQFSAAGLHSFDIAGHIKLSDLCQKKFRAE